MAKNPRVIEIQKDSLRRRMIYEFKSSLDNRVNRYYSVYKWKFTPHTHFQAISDECPKLYGEGYYFACISLCQSVAEALSRFLCQRTKVKCYENHMPRVDALKKKEIISDEACEAFKRIHNRRNDFHHFNPDVPSENKELQEISFGVLKGLEEIEKEVFEIPIKNGALVPKYPQLWAEDTMRALARVNQ